MEFKKINDISVKDAVKIYEQEFEFGLVKLLPKTKKAYTFDWNVSKKSVLNDIKDEDNIGIVHKFSNTVAIDIDDDALFDKVKEILDTSLPLNDGEKHFWELETAKMCSGKTNKGGKQLFRLPANNNYTRKVLNWNYYTEDEYDGLVDNNNGKLPDGAHGKTITVFELRCGAVQDVLPPSLHPDVNENGEHYKYQWVNDAPILDAPEDLIFLLEHWDDCVKFLKVADPKAWKKDKEDKDYKSITSERKINNIKSESYSILERFKEEIRVEDALLANGYTHNRRNRWVKPNSKDKNDDGIVVYPNNKVYAFNTSDVLGDGRTKSSYDIYDLNNWAGFKWGRKQEEMCKLLGIEAPKSGKITLTDDEYAEKLEEITKKEDKIVLKNEGYPNVLTEMCKAIRMKNEKVNEKKGEYIGFKSGAGVKMITYSEGQAVERTPDACDIRNIVCDGFFWDGGKVDEKTGCIIEVQPTMAECDEIVKAKSESKFDLPIYDRISQGAFLTEDGRIINKFGLNSISTNVKNTHDGKEYSMCYNIFMAHTVEIPQIPDKILPEHIEKAKQIIKSCYSGFWFKKEAFDEWDDTISFHNVVFALGIACFRYGYTDCRSTPIFVCNKHKAGDGASFLQRIMCMQAFNLKAEDVMAGNFTGEKSEDAQLLTSIGAGRYGHFIFDNMPTSGRTEGMEKFKSVTTSPKSSFRTMYTQEVGVQKNETFFMMNGINMRLTADITRRVFVSELERPDNSISHLESEEEVKTRAYNSHPQLIWAFKVLYDAWAQKGKPLPPKLDVDFSSYLSVYNVIGGMLIEHYPNMLKNLKEVQQDDNEEEQNIDGLYNAIVEIFGIGVKKSASEYAKIVNEDLNVMRYPKDFCVARPLIVKYLYPNENYPKLASGEGVGVILKRHISLKSMGGLVLRRNARREYYVEYVKDE